MTNRHQGWDQQEIKRVTDQYFGGERTNLASAIGADTTERNWQLKVSEHICERFGSIEAFAALYPPIENNVWTDDMSVLFTSFWGWDPITWGTVGWSGQRGLTRRANLMAQLSDPFITVCYVTSNQTDTDPDLKGKIAGFYVVSHEIGDRDEFTHPIHHGREPSKWRHSNRALRAFSYLPEYRPSAMDVFPNLTTHARHVSAMGEVLTDPQIIERLRTIPYEEVEVYQPVAALAQQDEGPQRGMVPAGPAASEGYEVPNGTQNVARDLYILRLNGNVAAYLGREAEARSIIKVGLSASPDLRRQALQKSMPRGSFRWVVDRTRKSSGLPLCANHAVAVRGEDAMKRHLAAHADWLGGEFYLAHDNDIETAWQMSCAAVDQQT